MARFPRFRVLLVPFAVRATSSLQAQDKTRIRNVTVIGFPLAARRSFQSGVNPNAAC